MRLQTVTTDDLANLQSRFIYPRFSQEEYERRFLNVQSLMREHGLSCLLIAGGSAAYGRLWSNITYLTNMIGKAEQCAYVLFTNTGDSYLVMRGHAISASGGMLARSVTHRVIMPDPDPISAICDAIRSLGYEGESIGIVEPDTEISIPRNHWEHLRAELPKTNFHFVTAEFLQMRLVKSKEELQFLARSAEINDEGVRALQEGLKPGMTEAEAFALVYAATIRHGGEVGMVQLASTSMDDPDLNDQRPRPVERVIQKKDMINNELGMFYNGYETQTGKPIFMGPATPPYLDLFDRATELYHEIADTLRVGSSSATAVDRARRLTQNGYQIFGAFLQGMHGTHPRHEPRVTVVGVDDIANSTIEFQEGMSFVVQAHVADSDFRRAVFLADTYVVSRSGPVCLNQFGITRIEL